MACKIPSNLSWINRQATTRSPLCPVYLSSWKPSMNVVGVDYWAYHRRHHLNHSASAVHVFARPLFRNQYCFNNNQINCKFIDFDCELIEMCIYASFRSLTNPICTYLAAGLLAVPPAGLATINRHYPRASASNSDPSSRCCCWSTSGKQKWKANKKRSVSCGYTYHREQVLTDYCLPVHGCGEG